MPKKIVTHRTKNKFRKTSPQCRILIKNIIACRDIHKQLFFRRLTGYSPLTSPPESQTRSVNEHGFPGLILRLSVMILALNGPFLSVIIK